MTIYQSGAFNAAASSVPNVNIVVQQPTNQVLSGVATNIAGIVGTASYGPKNIPTVIGGVGEYISTFGPVLNRTYDMGTPLATASLQGANNFVCVRVTDGTDTAATVSIQASCLTVASLYTGSYGNNLTVTIANGSKTGTTKVIVAGINGVNEVFDNISGSGNTLWVNIAAAINTGVGQLSAMGSRWIVATAGSGTTAPTLATYSLAGGTDGVSTVTDSTLLGTNASPPTGLYALQGQGCQVAMLSDATATTTWSQQVAFAAGTSTAGGEGCLMVISGASGETIANAITNKASAGIDTPYVKHLLGNFLFWNDTYNQVVRAVSPQGFALGMLASLSPEQSAGNKPIAGIVGSQKTGLVGSNQSNNFTNADLLALTNAGIDTITNPIPYGNVWGLRNGLNASSNAAIRTDNWARMTNFIAQTLNSGMGKFVNATINKSTFANVTSTISAFLYGLVQSGVLALNSDGSLSYIVQCNAANNPQSSTALGNLICSVQVTYQSIALNVDVFLLGGASVVTQISTASNQ